MCFSSELTKLGAIIQVVFAYVKDYFPVGVFDFPVEPDFFQPFSARHDKRFITQNAQTPDNGELCLHLQQILENLLYNTFALSARAQ